VTRGGAAPANRPPWRDPAIVLPVASVAIFLAESLSGMSSFGKIPFYTPVWYITLVAMFVFAFWWQGRAPTAKLVVGGALLFLLVSFLGVAFSVINSTIVERDESVPLAAFVFFLRSMALAAAIMVVGSALCGDLGTLRHWSIAIIGWPLLATLAFVTAELLPDELRVSWIYYFCFPTIIFGFLGFWLSDQNRASADVRAKR
jgi:hypothetical protein